MPQYFGKFNGFIHDTYTSTRITSELSKAVRIMQQQGSGTGLSLIVISFLYGIFHAAGPGHGKLIIATYLATHRTKLKLGIGLSFASAFIQGATAVLLVEVTVKLLNLTLTDTDTAAQSLEIISYALITILGLVLTLVALKKLLHRHSHDGHCDHSHLRYQENLKENIPIVSFISMALSIGFNRAELNFSFDICHNYQFKGRRNCCRFHYFFWHSNHRINFSSINSLCTNQCREVTRQYAIRPGRNCEIIQQCSFARWPPDIFIWSSAFPKLEDNE